MSVYAEMADIAARLAVEAGVIQQYTPYTRLRLSLTNRVIDGYERLEANLGREPVSIVTSVARRMGYL